MAALSSMVVSCGGDDSNDLTDKEPVQDTSATNDEYTGGNDSSQVDEDTTQPDVDNAPVGLRKCRTELGFPASESCYELQSVDELYESHPSTTLSYGFHKYLCNESKEDLRFILLSNNAEYGVNNFQVNFPTESGVTKYVTYEISEGPFCEKSATRDECDINLYPLGVGLGFTNVTVGHVRILDSPPESNVDKYRVLVGCQLAAIGEYSVRPEGYVSDPFMFRMLSITKEYYDMYKEQYESSNP